ncbi:hypothetical protein C1645_825607 [Glomus cerebriforme]|uniref:Uncharacterized protein n=1 Tax=Glomus cerebriforme TaxID=658196 RepID=A0A397SWB5_9GLOM|nr:hypothetical protein C1645_825607 [Glomus cerebriforme]
MRYFNSGLQKKNNQNDVPTEEETRIYNTQHALVIIDQNDGLDVIISNVHITAVETEFSYSDKINILKFVQERSRQVIKNHSTIQQRNEGRKEQYANKRKELAGIGVL